MIVDAKAFKDEVTKLIDTLYETQKSNMEKAAQLIANSIEKLGVVHVFGSGHSLGLGIDITGRPGSLVPIHIMSTSDFVTKGVVSLDTFQSKTDIFERKPGIAGDLYELYDIRPQDVFIIISNSGINGIVIDFAALAKENGHKVIVITSKAHTMAEDSRHPSGKKLYMYGDIVIDNCGPHGDALLETDGVAKVCSVSSICNNLIAQAIAARVVEIIEEDGEDAPVLTGDEEHDSALLARYEGRI